MLSNIFEIKQNKIKFQQVLPNHMITAMMLLNKNLVIKYLNPAAEAILVKSLNSLYNQSIEDLIRKASVKKERFVQLLSSGQEFNDGDVMVEFMDQAQITIDLTASSIEFNNEPHILLEFKQIDHQKQISEEAFQHQQWESGRDLIRGLAHEIKNPLGGLRGAAQLLDNDLSGEQKEYTAMIIEQADRLTNLVDRLLGPNQLPKISKQNIHVALEKVIQLVNFNNPKGIKLYRDYDPSIPDIKFDEDKIQQAILNIVNNAIQAIDSSNTILLKTRVASNQIINGKRVKLGVQISIIDDGPGIPENIQGTLFYPMVSGRSDGTGLGLSICQTLIHQHRGKLLCTSQPGKTEFTILLPICGDKI